MGESYDENLLQHLDVVDKRNSSRGNGVCCLSFLISSGGGARAQGGRDRQRTLFSMFAYKSDSFRIPGLDSPQGENGTSTNTNAKRVVSPFPPPSGRSTGMIGYGDGNSGVLSNENESVTYSRSVVADKASLKTENSVPTLNMSNKSLAEVSNLEYEHKESRSEV